jgi:hypothetical protein
LLPTFFFSPITEIAADTSETAATLGTKADAPADTVSLLASAMSYLKGILNKTISIFAETKEIETHLHSNVFAFGAAATPDGEIHRADRALGNATPFTLTSGNAAMGAWVQIFGSADTPVVAGKTFFDFNKVLVISASDNNFFIVQISYGEASELANNIATGEYTEFGFVRQSTQIQSDTVLTQIKRIPSGTKVWARCACNGQNAKTMSFIAALHEYNA